MACAQKETRSKKGWRVEDTGGKVSVRGAAALKSCDLERGGGGGGLGMMMNGITTTHEEGVH